jgi:hypothetical protein
MAGKRYRKTVTLEGMVWCRYGDEAEHHQAFIAEFKLDESLWFCLDDTWYGKPMYSYCEEHRRAKGRDIYRKRNPTVQMVPVEEEEDMPIPYHLMSCQTLMQLGREGDETAQDIWIEWFRIGLDKPNPAPKPLAGGWVDG